MRTNLSHLLILFSVTFLSIGMLSCGKNTSEVSDTESESSEDNTSVTLPDDKELGSKEECFTAFHEGDSLRLILRFNADSINGVFTSSVRTGKFSGIRQSDTLQVKVRQEVSGVYRESDEKWLLSASGLETEEFSLNKADCPRESSSTATAFSGQTSVRFLLTESRKHDMTKTNITVRLSDDGFVHNIPAGEKDGRYRDVSRGEFNAYKIPAEALAAIVSKNSASFHVVYALKESPEKLIVFSGIREGEFKKEQEISTMTYNEFVILTSRIPEPILEPEVKKLLQEASRRYRYVMKGGNGKNPYTNDGYRTLGTDLDSREELRTYLGKVFTRSAVTVVSESFKLQNGRLMQPVPDEGTERAEWQDAEIKPLLSFKNERSYKFTVSYGANRTERLTVVLMAEDGKWKIDPPLPMF